MLSYCFDEETAIGPGIYEFFTQGSQGIIAVRGEPIGDQRFWEAKQKALVPYPKVDGAKIDIEFNRRFQNIQVNFQKCIDKALEKKVITHITGVGHGSGGVYALLGLLDLISRKFGQKLSIITLGQPHIGNLQFANYVNSFSNTTLRIFRVTNMDDYVPRLPPNVFQRFYAHTINEIWIELDDCLCATGNLFLCNGPLLGPEKFIGESLECNNQYKTENYAAHNGPYLGMMMECPPEGPPCFTAFHGVNSRFRPTKTTMNFENSQLIQQEISYQNKTYHSILARRKIEWVSHFDIFRSKLADKINFQTFNASLDLKFHRKKSKRNLKFPILATNPESHFKRKITLDDPQKRLQKFRKYAYYANKAYCIKNKGGMVGPGIYARAEISGNRELIIYLRGYDYNYDEEELVNFNMWRPYSNIPQAQVVAELYQDFLRAKKTLMEMISSLLRPQFHVRLAGFGVGGVHAVFTALELKMTEYYLDIEIYTFGQLRMGNLFFTHFVMTLFPNKIYRITHSHDRVPQLPERKNLEGHWHFDREYWITYSDNCECVDTSQMFVVYECIGPLVDGYIHENPHCNAGAQITNFSIDLSHSGPYFGQNMGMCPPSLEDDFDDI